MLEIEVPLMRYDITLPLLDGRVPIDDISFKPTRRVSSMVTSEDSPFRDGSFGLADLNIGYLWPAIEAGWQVVALPVFSKRKPVLGLLFCRSDRGIETPKDLEGRRIGTRQYRSAISIWMRGLLQERYDVDVSTFTWAVGVGELFPVHDTRVRRVPAQSTTSAVAALIDGDVDAIITDISDRALFEALESATNVKRLFPDYMAEDLRLFRETGIYTPVHAMVMSKQLERQHPELAGQMYVAFEKAKQLAYDDILSERAGFSVVYLRERLLEQMQTWGDPWQYGVAANRSTIETFARFNAEQGMTRDLVKLETIFAQATLDT